MDNNMPACMNSRCLDLLYNHKAICEALVKSGESAASEILYRRASALRQLSACGNICELRCILDVYKRQALDGRLSRITPLYTSAAAAAAKIKAASRTAASVRIHFDFIFPSMPDGAKIRLLAVYYSTTSCLRRQPLIFPGRREAFRAYCIIIDTTRLL